MKQESVDFLDCSYSSISILAACFTAAYSFCMQLQASNWFWSSESMKIWQYKHTTLLNSKHQTNSRLILQDPENLRGDFGCLPTCAYIWQQKPNAKRSESISQQHAWERFDVFQRANSGSSKPWFPHDLKMPSMKMMMCILGQVFYSFKIQNNIANWWRREVL